MDSTGDDHVVGGGEPNDVVRPFSHREDEDQQQQQHHNSHPLTGDGASPGKIFIGGLARETTIAQFIKHFGKYGEITDSDIMKDRKTGQPRGFGFITYADPSVVDKVIEDNHVINGKKVEIKRTITTGAGGSRDFRTMKIFVGIPSTVTEKGLEEVYINCGAGRSNGRPFSHRRDEDQQQQQHDSHPPTDDGASPGKIRRGAGGPKDSCLWKICCCFV